MATFAGQIGVATAMMFMWEAFEVGFGGRLDSIWCAALVFCPVLLYIVICKYYSGPNGQEIQIIWAFRLTICFSMVTGK